MMDPNPSTQLTQGAWHSSKIFNKGEALQICSYTHRTPPVYPIDCAKSIGEYSKLNAILIQTFIWKLKLKERSENIPTSVHILCKQRNTVLSITANQIVIIDVKGSWCVRRRLGKRCNERPDTNSPGFAVLRRSILEGVLCDNGSCLVDQLKTDAEVNWDYTFR